MLELFQPILALAFAPLLPGIINKTKAFFGGRRGPPLFQLYYNLARLLRKGAVYSETTTWMFRLGPSAGLAIAAFCLVFLPLGNLNATISFQGDLIFLIYE